MSKTLKECKDEALKLFPFGRGYDDFQDFMDQANELDLRKIECVCDVAAELYAQAMLEEKCWIPKPE